MILGFLIISLKNYIHSNQLILCKKSFADQ